MSSLRHIRPDHRGDTVMNVLYIMLYKKGLQINEYFKRLLERRNTT